MRDHLKTIFQKLPRVLGVALMLQILLLRNRSNPLANLEVPSAPHWHPEEPPADVHPSTGSAKLPELTKMADSGQPNRVAPATTSITNVTKSDPTRSNNPPSRVTNSSSQTEQIVKPAPPPAELKVGQPGNRTSGAGVSAHPPTAISPIIQARIDKITQSELLAPVFHPPPMALLGIAGHDAFLRTPNGQMSLLREGGDSDGLKLLRIGTNRVLVEVAGEKKELMIFEGLGGESLLPK